MVRAERIPWLMVSPCGETRRRWLYTDSGRTAPDRGSDEPAFDAAARYALADTARLPAVKALRVAYAPQ